jgi:leucyl/phenylalanyl-tRNA--protein transferase
LIPWLTDDTPFPSVERALNSPNGLLAAGGELTVPRLLEAYRNGIFPWFNPGEPILWWSPNPRMVLIPGEFKTSRSLAKMLRNSVHEVRNDTVFEQVMRCCAAPRAKNRAGHPGTWIDEDMITAYCALHRLGYAHSVEVWMPKKSFQFQIEGETRRQRTRKEYAVRLPDASHRPLRKSNEMGSAMSTAMSERCPATKLSSCDSPVEWPVVTPGSQHSIADELELELVGGLYGVSIGRMFYGESMFSDVSNASKIALAHLARQLERWQFGMIDCQMNTPHLATLGAREIPRSEFIASLQELIHCAPIDEKLLMKPLAIPLGCQPGSSWPGTRKTTAKRLVMSGHPTDWQFDPDLFT